MITIERNPESPQPVLPPGSEYKQFVPYRIVNLKDLAPNCFQLGDIVFFLSPYSGPLTVVNATKDRVFTAGRFTGDQADISVQRALNVCVKLS